MNLHLGVYFAFSGPLNDLQPLVEDVAKTMIERGFGVDVESDNLNTLLVLKESDIGSWVNVNDFAKNLLENSILVVVPANPKREVEDEHSRNQREASRVDSGRSSRED